MSVSNKLYQKVSTFFCYGFSKVIFYFTFLIIFQMNPLQACKLWAVITNSGLTFGNLSEDGRSMIYDQLNSFYYQSEFMLNGWSIMGYHESNHIETISICRSPNTASNDSTLYWDTIQTLLENEEAAIGMGHLRLATSGSNTIPNPHPWIFQNNGVVYSLMHNGTVSKDLLLNLITDNGIDSSWLDLNPPQTFGNGEWSASGWSSVVDSELIMLLIMKKIILLNDKIEGFKSAISSLINSGVNAGQINLIFSDGYSLLVFGGTNGLHISENFEFTAVMTQPYLDANHQWQSISHDELTYITPDTLIRISSFIENKIDDSATTVHPSEFYMSYAYPNPFNGTVKFNLTTRSSGLVSVNIFSILGQVVDAFYVKAVPGQPVSGLWIPDANLPSGTYLIRATFDSFQKTQKILFIK